jgi:hypothetical protein
MPPPCMTSKADHAEAPVRTRQDLPGYPPGLKGIIGDTKLIRAKQIRLQGSFTKNLASDEYFMVRGRFSASCRTIQPPVGESVRWSNLH